MKNADKPAYPISEEESDRIDAGVNIYSGLTKREYFCLRMGVAASGDSELDEIIRKGERRRLAGLIAANLVSYDGIWQDADACATYVKEMADDLTNKLEKPTPLPRNS